MLKLTAKGSSVVSVVTGQIALICPYTTVDYLITAPAGAQDYFITVPVGSVVTSPNNPSNTSY